MFGRMTDATEMPSERGRGAAVPATEEGVRRGEIQLKES